MREPHLSGSGFLEPRLRGRSIPKEYTVMPPFSNKIELIIKYLEVLASIGFSFDLSRKSS
jgi:hypothetical protein